MPNWKKLIVSGSDASLNSLIVANGITGSLFGTASQAISSSYALSASYAPSPLTASYTLTASYVNPLRQDVLITGSLNITGSTTQIGNNTLLGNTTLSGSIIMSGSLGSTPTVKIYGDTQHNGYIRFDPVTTNIDQSISASYIYVSGSTNDLYFSQNGNGYNNTTRLRWLEGNLYTGLLNGGLITTQSSTVYQISSGSGIIVSLNASLNDNPYPVIQYLNWGNLSASIAPLTASYQQAFVGIDSTGNIYAQGTPFTNGQFDTIINIGNVLFQNQSTINGVKTQPSVAYGFEQAQNIFNRAFGPLKLSGYTLAPSGSSTGSLVVGSGTAYAPGSNYAINPNEPYYTVDSGTNTSKIFRYYQSGSTWVYLTNAGAGYTTIDPGNYSDSGTLTGVLPNEWTIQRVFWFPNSVTKAIVVYYGNNVYQTETEAIANISIESFVEAPNTAANAIYLGSVIIRGNGVFTTPADFTIVPGGLFRQVGGSGGGGSVVTQTLSGLSDVNISGPTDYQALVYDTTQLKWINASFISASISGNAATSVSASYALSSSYAESGSYTLNATTASYALTASNVQGGGANYVTLWKTNTSLTSSLLYQDTGSNRIGLNTTVPDYTFDVNGTGRFQNDLRALTKLYLPNMQDVPQDKILAWYDVDGQVSYMSTSSLFVTSGSYAVSSSYTLTASGVQGGTTNYLPLWTSGTTLSSSVAYQTGSMVIVPSYLGVGDQTTTSSFSNQIPITYYPTLNARSLVSTNGGVRNMSLSGYTVVTGAPSTSQYGGFLQIETSQSNANNFSGALIGGDIRAAHWGSGASVNITGIQGLATLYSGSSSGNVKASIMQADIYASSNLNQLFGSHALTNHYGTGTITRVYGTDLFIGNRSTGTITQAIGLGIDIRNYVAGTIDTAYGISIGGPNDLWANTGGGTVTNVYGLFISSSIDIASSTKYAIYSDSTYNSYLKGNLGINQTNPAYNLDVNGSGNFSNGLTVTGSAVITQNVTASNALINGTITAQTLVVQTVTSSVVYSSGSNIFGNSLSNTQQFTGSVSITGSLAASLTPDTLTNVVSYNTSTGQLYYQTTSSLNVTSASYAATSSNILGGAQYYVPFFDTNTTVSSSFLYQSGSLLKTRFGGSDVGLYLDFSNLKYTLGDNANNVGFISNLGNSSFAIGDPTYYGQGTSLIVDDNNELIKTTYGGSDLGLSLDFTNNQYKLGDYNNGNNGTKLTLDDINSRIDISKDTYITGSLYLSSSLHSAQGASAGIGTTTIASIATGSYKAGFFDYVVSSGGNARAGTVMSVWDGSSVQYTDNSTLDIGSTTAVSMSVALSGANVLLQAAVSADTWDVKTTYRLI